MTFERRQAPNLADDKRVFCQPELCAKSGVIAGLEECFNAKAAEDACVHFRPPNASGQIAASHGVSRADEVSRCFGRDSLRGEENGIRRRSLERTKRRAMNMMDDYRHTCAFCGKPPQNAALSAVS